VSRGGYPRRGAVAAAIIAAVIVVLWLGPGAAAHTPGSYRHRREHIVERARHQQGAPFVYGGSSPRGFDCSGFTRWVFNGHGAHLPHSAAGQFALAGSRGFKRLWERGRLAGGDLVFFDTTGAGIGHVGIYVGHGKFVSATSSRGVQIESVRDPYYWGPLYIGATRVSALSRK
jgi:cell wall-associated NlpC family hydrolase